MKHHLLMATLLSMALVTAGNANAATKSTNNDAAAETTTIQQQTQTANQGDSSQIKVQNNEQTQSGTAGTTDGVQNQQQTQQKLQNGTGAGNQNQNQNQLKNQGDDNQIKNKEQTKAQNSTAEQRRSQVANAVQELLQISEREGGIGQEVKVIAQNQTQNHEKLETSLEEVKSRSSFSKFFIGPKYGEINNANKVLEQNREQIRQLNQLRTQLANESDARSLTEQIQTLEQTNTDIEDSLKNAQKGFSLFGWAFKIFAD